MKSHKTLWVLSLVALGGAIISIGNRQSFAQGQAPGAGQINIPDHPFDPFKDIDIIASTLTPNDASTVRALVDKLWEFPRVYPVPASIQDQVKNRLVSAEISYRQGRRQGVEEQGVVRALNALAEAFGAPDYAMTSPRQVRVIRMGLAISEPKFMGAGIARRGMKVGDSIDSSMSPLQAVHLLAFTIEQKLSNPEFQVAPGEWDGTHYQIQIEQLQSLQQAKDQKPSGTIRKAVGSLGVSDPKRAQLRSILSKSSPSISTVELVNQTLALLEID